MKIDFIYFDEIKLFLQLFLLGATLSAIVMYITESTKKVIVTDKAYIFVPINFFISMGFGIGWARTFSDMSWGYCIWLGILLFLGSSGLYAKLENSDGLLGKTVRSYTQYVNELADSAQFTTDPLYTTDELEAMKQELTEAAEKEKAAAVETAKSELSAAVKAASSKAKSEAESKAKAEAEKTAKAEADEDKKQAAEAAALKAQIERLQKELATKETPSAPKPAAIKFRMPVNYIGISQGFQPSHLGVDFGYSYSILGANQPVYAAIGGRVVAATQDGGGAGTYVKLQTDDAAAGCTWYTYYKHLSRLDVKAGDTVSIGRQLGLMGDTGDADGNHLHFDLVRVPYQASYDNSNNAQRAKYSLDPLLHLTVDHDQTVGDVTAATYKLKYAQGV